MEKEKEIHSCVDCGTQNCKYKTVLILISASRQT